MGQTINTFQKPLILLENKNTLEELERLKKNNKIWQISDIYQLQLKELFEINNPHLADTPNYNKKLKNYIAKQTKKSQKLVGNWIYFPWNRTLLHSVNEKDYYSLRTNRNRNLITLAEQQKLYTCCIGIVGLSVGSGLATGLAYQGIGKNLKLAEFDRLETTNLNRIKAGMQDIGHPKLKIAIQQIYEVDPYINLHLYPQGITIQNIDDFIYSNPKPQIIFEIIDDFEIKIKLRLEARKAGIPIIMFANLGDSILVNIERYDKHKSLPLFNGIIGDLPEKILENPHEDKNKYAIQIVGKENVPQRAIESVKNIGKTLTGRPQLSSTVTISGAYAVYLTRKILLDKSKISGRYIIKFDQLFTI